MSWLQEQIRLIWLVCTHKSYKLNGEGAIPDADATFDNFEAITGRQPMTWQMFAEQHQDELRQSLEA